MPAHDQTQNQSSQNQSQDVKTNATTNPDNQFSQNLNQQAGIRGQTGLVQPRKQPEIKVAKDAAASIQEQVMVDVDGSDQAQKIDQNQDFNQNPSPAQQAGSNLKSKQSEQTGQTDQGQNGQTKAVNNKAQDLNQANSQNKTKDTDLSRSSSGQTQSQDSSGRLSQLSTLLKVAVSLGFITEDQAKEINSQHLSTGKPVEDLLKESEIISETELVKAKAEFNNIPFIKVSETGISPEALSRIDESVARRYQVLPFALDQKENRLDVAMVDPLNVSAVNFIEQKTGLNLKTFYALPSELERLINQRYAQDLSSDVSKAIEETSTISTQKGSQDIKTRQKGGLIRAAPINKIVNTILDYAMQSRASDVHIEPQPGRTRVRYRIDGVLQEKLILPESVHDAVVSRIKILSDLKIDEKRVPQDGRFDYAANGKEVDLRVSTCPTIHGEKVVMRLLKKNAGVPGLHDLGLRDLALKNVEKSIHIPHGIILVTGPTGSGKTTTLYSVLNKINTPKVNIITLEDPVEYQMKGVSQVQVNPQAGLNFANGLRSFLRQDPDIIMVGEIRDEETAELAVQASLTGHLVFSTLHTNSASGALPRLMDMGVEPFLLSSSIILTMGQRVVRRINPEFKEEYKPEKAVIEDIKNVLGDRLQIWCKQNGQDPNDLTLYRAKEDRPQTEPEFKGMIGIFEVMDITEKIKQLIDEQATSDKIEKEAKNNGMMLMKQDGYIKALEGITTIEEVIRVAEVK